MSATRSSTLGFGLDDADLDRAGRYVTDGVHLYRLLEPLDEGVCGTTAVEDCGSLEIALVASDDLRERTRPVGWGAESRAGAASASRDGAEVMDYERTQACRSR